MKKAMKLLGVLALLAGSMPAQAADIYLGTITSAGADTTNATTGSPFIIPNNVKLSVQCDATAYLLVDTTSAVTSSNGAKLLADLFFQTSTYVSDNSSAKVSISPGTNNSNIVRVISASGTSNCKIFRRYGNE